MFSGLIWSPHELSIFATTPKWTPCLDLRCILVSPPPRFLVALLTSYRASVIVFNNNNIEFTLE